MKKLVIVCEEKLRRYGDFLSQLISGTDDKEGSIIGVKDGSTAAQVWTEKEYASNAAQISSEQYILFIGNSKLLKDKRQHMQKKFSEHGMNYGWLGKQAALFVDHFIPFSEYDAFYQYALETFAAGNQPEAVRLLPAKQDKGQIQEDYVVEAEPVDSHQQEEVKPEINEKKGLKTFLPLKAAKTVFKKTADIGKTTFNKVSDNVNTVVKSKEIEDQQYTCLIISFYLHDLSTWLGV